jgi:hypothetical protein
VLSLKRPSGSLKGCSRLPASGLVLLAVLGTACGPSPAARDAAPIEMGSDPSQDAIGVPEIIRFELGGWTWTITPRAAYVLRGIVVSKERYHAGIAADLSPMDVAVAWGRLTEDGLHRRISWSQTSRWYVWTYNSGFPRDNDFISRWSSNTHVIPSTPVLRRALRYLKEGRPAELAGLLVDAHGTKGGQWWDWNSSLSREDHGDGSCEVLYLTRLKIDGRVYE